MKLLVDNQLPAALVLHLRGRGHDCLHVLDIGFEEASDLEIWNRCIDDDRVLVSKDEDFVFLANRSGDNGRLIWVRLGNCRNPALLASFDSVHDQLLEAFAAGTKVVEVR
jgi:predicted nuclease of predicted toxin-antitoxin system